MGIAVDRHQVCPVDFGIALGGAQRGVAQQFLNGAQIPAAGQEMGGEAVAQRMGRRRLGKAQERPEPSHLALHHAGVEAPATGADK